MKNWIIVGATSGIAKPVIEMIAQRGDRICVTAREFSVAKSLADELASRYSIEVIPNQFDALNESKWMQFVAEIESKFGEVDGVFWAIGALYSQQEMESDPTLALKQHIINYTCAVPILTHFAQRMSIRGSGVIVGLGSVAGDRTRRSNYYYGSDKAAFHSLLEGLRLRYATSNVRIVTVKPGPVYTRMMEGRKLPLTVSPERTAKDIFRALSGRQEIVYTPWFWRYIMFIIRHLPAFIFRKLPI